MPVANLCAYKLDRRMQMLHAESTKGIQCQSCTVLQSTPLGEHLSIHIKWRQGSKFFFINGDPDTHQGQYDRKTFVRRSL